MPCPRFTIARENKRGACAKSCRHDEAIALLLDLKHADAHRVSLMAIYTNLDGTTPDKNLVDILKWQVVDRLAGRRRKSGGPFETPRVPNDGKALFADHAHAT
jgi:hypothetical protein